MQFMSRHIIGKVYNVRLGVVFFSIATFKQGVIRRMIGGLEGNTLFNGVVHSNEASS